MLWQFRFQSPGINLINATDRLCRTWANSRNMWQRGNPHNCAAQVHWPTVKVIFESECQFPSLESATSQLSQSQFGALHRCSMEVPFSEMWSHKMLLEMSNSWGMSSIYWFSQSLLSETAAAHGKWTFPPTIPSTLHSLMRSLTLQHVHVAFNVWCDRDLTELSYDSQWYH